jgi:hypothetical protein
MSANAPLLLLLQFVRENYMIVHICSLMLGVLRYISQGYLCNVLCLGLCLVLCMVAFNKIHVFQKKKSKINESWPQETEIDLPRGSAANGRVVAQPKT